MNVLVTGANGFIGKSLVAELSSNSYEVFAFGNLNSSNKNLQFVKSGNYFQCDLREEINFDIAERIETIFHCAGLAHQFGNVEKEEFQRVNVEGTVNIAKLAVKLKVKKLILLSSVSVYGSETERKLAFDERTICNPRDFYAESKMDSEHAARKICEVNGISLIILRPATVIGEGDRGNFLRLVKTIARKRFIWIGKGANHKSLIHKNDVARACAIFLNTANQETEIFNVAAEPLTMKEIVDEIAFNLKVKIPKISVSEKYLQKIFDLNSKTIKIGKALKLAETVRKWTAEDVYSGEKLRSEYGFEPQISVKEAIAREVKWYLANKNV